MSATNSNRTHRHINRDGSANDNFPQVASPAAKLSAPLKRTTLLTIVVGASVSIYWSAHAPKGDNDNLPPGRPPRPPATVKQPRPQLQVPVLRGRIMKPKPADRRPNVPAAVRHMNPGAQYPANWAKKFGMKGSAVIGGGHLIATFPSAIAGAAANMYLLSTSYVGMPIGAAGAKWTGGNSFGVPGYDPRTVLTKEMVRDPAFIIPFMKSIAFREAGRTYPLTDDQWLSAYNAYRAGKYP